MPARRAALNQRLTYCAELTELLRTILRYKRAFTHFDGIGNVAVYLCGYCVLHYIAELVALILLMDFLFVI